MVKITSFDFNAQFKNAFDLIENSKRNIFITGKAGTGKSTLLKHFRDSTSKNIIVLAPTGVAAVNIKGQTIHSFFRFKPDITPENVPLIKIYKSRKEIYKKIDVIIIDEMSMVRADLLDCIDAFLRIHGKNKKKPFGGVQMIFIGDLYQLPPVVTMYEREVFYGLYKSPYFFDAKSFSSLNMQYLCFDKVYRQKDDDFINLLNVIRNRTVSEKHLAFLNSRYQPSFQPKPDDFYIYLTTTNQMADNINRGRLQLLKTRPFHFDGFVEGSFDNKYLPTQKSLDLKFGAQVMLLNNDSKGRWVNGSIGKVVSVFDNSEDSDMIRVELSDGKVVDVAPFTWEMFRFFFNEENQRLESETIGAFTQYPLRLAWAVTIHKSQGKTFSRVIVDIGHGTFAHGQVYVALSRCESMEGLILKRRIYKNHILMDQEVVNFMENNFHEGIS